MKPPENAEPFKVGDPIRGYAGKFYKNEEHTSVHTIVDIIPLPKDPQEKKQVLEEAFKRLADHPNWGFATGENLSDDPERAPRIDQNALYIFEG